MLELETPDSITLRCREFKQLAKELVLQIAATDPIGIDGAHMLNVIPIQFRDDESAVAKEALLDQDWIKDQSITVGEMLRKVEEQLGTPIRITRFTRYGVDDT
jgi:translation elongation factor EF-Ts